MGFIIFIFFVFTHAHKLNKFNFVLFAQIKREREKIAEWGVKHLPNVALSNFAEFV